MSTSSSKASKKAGSYHHGDLRQALIGAARDILREGGTGDLSLRAIARRVGVSHASAYYHFEDRTALIAAVAVVAFDELAEAMAAVEPQEDVAAPEQLKAIAGAYVTFALENPQEFRLMFLPELRSDAVRTEVETAGRAGHERTIALIATLQNQGQVREGDPELISISAWAMMHGLATLMIDGPLYRNAQTEEGREALVSSAVEYLLFGVLDLPPLKRRVS